MRDTTFPLKSRRRAALLLALTGAACAASPEAHDDRMREWRAASDALERAEDESVYDDDTPLGELLVRAQRANPDVRAAFERWRAALERVQAAGGTGRQLVGLVTSARRCPRQGYEITAGDEVIGKVCSGSISPTLDTNIATAYVRSEFAAPGTELGFRIKDKTEACTVTELPFYKRQR